MSLGFVVEVFVINIFVANLIVLFFFLQLEDFPVLEQKLAITNEIFGRSLTQASTDRFEGLGIEIPFSN